MICYVFVFEKALNSRKEIYKKHHQTGESLVTEGFSYSL